MITALKGGFPPPGLCNVHTSSRLLSYTETSEGVSLHFANGSTTHADAIVGADGIRSAVRESMFNKARADGSPTTNANVAAKWSGTIAYRALVTKEKLESMNGGPHSTTSNFMIVSPEFYYLRTTADVVDSTAGRGRYAVPSKEGSSNEESA